MGRSRAAGDRRALRCPGRGRQPPGAGQVASGPLGEVPASLAAGEKAARTSASGTRGGNEWHGGKLAQRSAALPARACSQPSEGCSACDVANSWPHFQNGKEDLWRPEPCGHGATTGSKLRKAGPSACPCGFSGSAKTCTYKHHVLQSISWQQKQK